MCMWYVTTYQAVVVFALRSLFFSGSSSAVASSFFVCTSLYLVCAAQFRLIEVIIVAI